MLGPFPPLPGPLPPLAGLPVVSTFGSSQDSASKSYGEAMGSLGKLGVQLVALQNDLEDAKQKVAALTAENTALKATGEADKKQIAALQDELKFNKGLVTRRQRIKKVDPMSLPEYINRILDLGMPWNREQISTLSCISKPWRTECQARLFSRFKKLALVDRQGCDLLTAFLEKKAHLAAIAKEIELSFKPSYGGPLDFAEIVPISLLKLLTICKSLEVVTLLDFGAYAATKKTLAPLSAKITTLSIDPNRFAQHGKIVEVSNGPQGLFSDWQKLKTLNMTRVQVKIVDKVQHKCALTALSLNQCLINGSLRWFIQGSKKTLTSLVINGAAGLMLDDVLGLIQDVASKLQHLTIRSTRYVSEINERSFDSVLAACTALQSLNLDLDVVPISDPATLLSTCSKLEAVEFKRADWVAWQDWLQLFGATSIKLKSVIIHNSQYWSAADRNKMQEAWKWKGIDKIQFPQQNRRQSHDISEWETVRYF